MIHDVNNFARFKTARTFVSRTKLPNSLILVAQIVKNTQHVGFYSSCGSQHANDLRIGYHQGKYINDN